MILSIDTTNNLKTVLKLDGQELVHEYDSPRDQDVLSAIDELLKKNNTTPKNLTAIEVNPGPGSFTGTRVGVTIANTFAQSLNIPVNSQKPPIEPIYNQPPNITKSKKHRTKIAPKLDNQAQ